MIAGFILEIAWKSLALSAGILALLALLRSRSAADRARVLRLGVLLLLLLPLAAAVAPALDVEEPAPARVFAPILATVEAPAPPLPALEAVAGPTEGPVASPAITPGRLVVPVYAAGVLLVLAHLGAGLATLSGWTRRARPVTCPAWKAALRRALAAAPEAEVQLLVSARAPSPLSWGLRRPTILIDPHTLARPDDADAVLAHELAHVRRGDWPALMLSRVAVAVFWFNPLVWILERALVQQAEEAADQQAVRQLEPTGYARALLRCIRQAPRSLAPANGMGAGCELARRLDAVLDPKRRALRSGSLWTTTAMAACIVAAAPVAALELSPPRPELPVLAEPVPAPRPAIEARPLPAPPLSPAAPAAPAPPPAPPAAAAAVEIMVPVELPPTIAAEDVPPTAFLVEQSVGAATAALQNLRVEVKLDGLPKRRHAALEPAYAESIAAVGPRYRRLPDDELFQLQIHSVSPQYLEGLAAAGYGDLDVDEVVQLRIHGVSPRYLRDLAAAGYRGLEVDEIVGLRLLDVSPAQVAEFSRLGYRELTPGQMKQMRVLGVTPDFIRELTEAGYGGLTLRQLVRMRTLGLDADRLRNGRGDPGVEALLRRVFPKPS